MAQRFERPTGQLRFVRRIYDLGVNLEGGRENLVKLILQQEWTVTDDDRGLWYGEAWLDVPTVDEVQP